MSPRDLVGVAEAARLLGISPRTLRRWLRDGRIPYALSASGEPMLRRADILVNFGPSDED